MHSSRSVSKSKRSMASQMNKSLCKSASSNRVQLPNYFCHYRNAMYMGPVQAFQKNGVGLILHDNGDSSICSYHNDFKNGHNVVYSGDRLMSVVYERGKLKQGLCRDGAFMVLIRFNKEEQPEGKAFLFDFQNRNIINVTYKRGIIAEKRFQNDPDIINRVFQLQLYENLLSQAHIRALRYQLDEKLPIKAIRSDSKISIGFYEKGMMNGLGMVLSIRNPNQESGSLSTERDCKLYLRTLERGYFYNSVLNGTGEKWFKNGTCYYGGFDNNIFEGKGLLKNNIKNNWVYANFTKGNMSELIQSSNEANIKRVKRIIEAMHERKSNWINREVTPECPQVFQKEIQRILQHKVSVNLKTLQERKSEVLRRIQDNFLSENHSQNLLFSARNDSSFNQMSTETKLKLKQFNQNDFHIKYAQNRKQNNPQSNHMQSISVSMERSGETENQLVQATPKHKFKLNMFEVTNTSSSTNAKSYGNQLCVPSINQKSPGASPVRNEAVTQKFGSKEMIGKSKLFKYMSKQSQQVQDEPPSFKLVAGQPAQ